MGVISCNRMINRQKIQKLHELTRVVDKAKAVASEQLRTAQDRYNHVEEEVKRDGKTQKIKRKLLWDEVFYLGVGCQAADILKQHHPGVFESFMAQEKAADDLRKFTMTELDLDYQHMTLSSYVRLTEALFNMLMDERENTKDGSVPSPVDLSDGKEGDQK